MKKFTTLTTCVFWALVADAIKSSRGGQEALECRGERCVIAPGHAVHIRLESPRGCLIELCDVHGHDAEGRVTSWWCLTPRANVSIAAEMEPEDWRPTPTPAAYGASSPTSPPSNSIVIDYGRPAEPGKLFKPTKPRHIRVYRSVE